MKCCDEELIVLFLFQYDGWPSGMEMPPTSMYGDHIAALDTLAAHHAAAQQHMNHSSRHNIALTPLTKSYSLWRKYQHFHVNQQTIFDGKINFKIQVMHWLTIKVQFLIKF